MLALLFLLLLAQTAFTSALDAANEERLYGQLAGLAITPISVSHHPTLLKHHHQVLEPPGDGNWTLHAASDYRWV